MTLTFQSALTVDIPARQTNYPLYIHAGTLAQVGDILAHHLPAPRKVLLISDSVVYPFYGQQVQDALTAAGYAVTPFAISSGEASKNLDTVQEVYEIALNAGLSRKDVILALGGGVVGDLAGFCAATYFRGIPFVQVPTTLLAQVDSSVGGKVAVNFKQSKNGVGAFYQPKLVLIDPNCLKTLPEPELKAGLAEVVKYGMIESTCTGGDTGFFQFLEKNASDYAPVMANLIQRCCAIKAAVVQADETEQSGVRAVLNLGHTFGHALEGITHYKTYLHGEAVAIGMVQATQLAVNQDLFPQEAMDRLTGLLTRLEISQTPLETYLPEELLTLMRQDKKASGGQITLVLPQGRLGHVVVRDDVPEAVISKVLA